MNFNNGKKVFVVVQFQQKEKAPTCPVDALSRCGFFSYILHDKDTTENGENKGLHAHLYIEALKGMSSKNWIEKLAEIFQVENTAISVEIALSPMNCVKYELHLLPQNIEDGKHQYQRDEIITNDDKKVDDFLSMGEIIPINQISVELLEKVPNERELYKLVGLQNFKKALDAWNILKNAKVQVNATIKELTENMGKAHEYIHFLMKQPTTNAVEKEMLTNISKILSLGSFD